MDVHHRDTARQRRRPIPENTATWILGLAGVAATLASRSPWMPPAWPASWVGGVGLAVTATAVVWHLARRADLRDDQARQHTDRIVDAIGEARTATVDALLDLTAAMCTVVDDLDQHTVRDAGLLRRELEDLLSTPPPPRPAAAPFVAAFVARHPEVEDPTTEVPAVTDEPATEASGQAPGVRDALDDDWRWIPAEQQAGA